MFDAAPNLHVENHEILGAKPRMLCFLPQETLVLEEKTRIQDRSQSEQELSCALHLHLFCHSQRYYRPFGMVIGGMEGRR